MLMGASVAVAAVGVVIALFFYRWQPALPDRLRASCRPLYALVHNKFYVDELYDACIVRPLYHVSNLLLFKLGDRVIIEGVVNGLAKLARLGGEALRVFQSGDLRAYARWTLLAALLLVLTAMGIGAF
jgi:NADH-quinone oxidoreductase subunit L